MTVQQRGAKWQVRIENKLLPRGKVFATFDDETTARNYKAHLQGMLHRGVVPLDLMQADERRGAKVRTLVAHFRESAPGPAPTDLPTLALLEAEVGDVRSTDITAPWADRWVQSMKLEKNMAPGTVRKRVESLARVLDWYIRKETPVGDVRPVNPLRMMPRGYSAYTPQEAAQVAGAGGLAKKDVARDRRFAPGDEQKIRDALAGVKRADRERALKVAPAFALLFDLILNTGLRLREAYWLRREDCDVARGVLNVRGTKGHRGEVKPRTVPLGPALREVLRTECEGRTGLLFPFWDGDPATLERTSNNLSARFSSLFAYAGLVDFHEHDLRHEATCRWVTMRDRTGRWMWSELEVCKIMGWKRTDMFLRYASLRGEDFADRML